MRPKERRDSGQNDLFKARLDQIVDMDHPLVKLSERSTGGSGGAIRRGLLVQAGSTAAAHAADGGALDPQAYA
jgi:hypothetical protein